MAMTCIISSKPDHANLHPCAEHDHDAATTDNVPSVGPSVLTHIKYSFHFFQELPEKWNKLSSETTAACTLDTAMPGVSLAASFFSRPHTPPQPPALERDSTLVVVVVVVVVVQELFSLMMSAICVQIRGHRSEVTRIIYHMAPVFVCCCIRSYHCNHSGFVGTISTLFCYVHIKHILFLYACKRL